ncbi:MAG: bifunctional diaminohydroxyphosphoribosylaminopyrimidine deaminase/5-amino-6-(5-phosphoribosylamino)uracil reductase RibD [Holophagales bacterium]|nr:bifunctional diaminohydroxyphosphoribosylaminopyrimidine deaminase/5-amino-6-(5-phosphoribosylamino)uracil reductase RibD [Holophagales bacterium]MXX61248.1 bifunctional diaminohydroxyphosphoribosylaminopyrimidine deaminase/5-amino-6-(5-phosphoribosylamino)uracil reductase RibD [Holophagales bacterium]MYC11600.1 bifunctional diaminohydroxyphosphoribosylaminopyrimidine deaminase/5-amino-6-(5-phosphoribosylamino)uracil reductase RibD [Holophagales bacterium]MYD22054.1 bifunctional diaminohydrox
MSEGPGFSPSDERAMARALTLARRGRYTVAPNPMVGAVVTNGGAIVGEGWHRQAGGEHAEAAALRVAGNTALDGTLYVTLEPCNHHGRTPPCADRVIESGVKRVVFAHRDPNPEVTGGGGNRLRAVGVRVEGGLLAGQAVEMNVPFLTRVVHRRPAVTLKWAMSLDGRIATATGDSQWISSEQGRKWALDLREEHQAIVVGSGTALADDPRLNRRLGRAEGPILRVVLDRRLRLSSTARMFELEGPVVIYTEAPREIGSSTSADAGDWATRRDRLRSAGAEVLALSAVEPADVLEDLFDRGVSSVLVEGGGEVLAAFSGSGLWDRAAVCCAPVLIGGAAAPGPLGGEGPRRLADALRLDELRVSRRGPDVILLGYRQGCLPELSRSVGG